jgi:hypothetical protein
VVQILQVGGSVHRLVVPDPRDPGKPDGDPVCHDPDSSLPTYTNWSLYGKNVTCNVALRKLTLSLQKKCVPCGRY